MALSIDNNMADGESGSAVSLNRNMSERQTACFILRAFTSLHDKG